MYSIKYIQSLSLSLSRLPTSSQQHYPSIPTHHIPPPPPPPPPPSATSGRQKQPLVSVR